MLSDDDTEPFALCRLHRSYRFDGALGELAQRVIAGSASELGAVLASGRLAPAALRHDLPDSAPEYAHWLQRLADGYTDYFARVGAGATLPELAQAFDRFRILLSTHEGPFGCTAINRMIEAHFHARALWYEGKAVMVLENQPELGVVNGDIGFVRQSPDGGWLVHFPQGPEPALAIPPIRLHSWQAAYALTVHKSQGSEYHTVAIVLADYAPELLRRRLLYTAVTRARESCILYASDSALQRVMLQD
jgi:exodeoxyribonuclease V alpha subunit